MFAKFAISSFAVLALVAGGALAEDKEAADCCSKKLACCTKPAACCKTDKKPGCCAKGMKCCAENRACCDVAPECCVKGLACCDEPKDCCGEVRKDDAKASTAKSDKSRTATCCSATAKKPATKANCCSKAKVAAKSASASR